MKNGKINEKDAINLGHEIASQSQSVIRKTMKSMAWGLRQNPDLIDEMSEILAIEAKRHRNSPTGS